MKHYILGGIICLLGLHTAAAASSLLPPLPALPAPAGPIVVVTSTPPPPPAHAPAAPVRITQTLEEAWAVDAHTVEVTLCEAVSEPPARTEWTILPRCYIRQVIATDDPQVWRLATDTLAPDTVYRVTWRDGEAVAFRTWRTERETSERYKSRYGDIF